MVLQIFNFLIIFCLILVKLTLIIMCSFCCQIFVYYYSLLRINKRQYNFLYSNLAISQWQHHFLQSDLDKYSLLPFALRHTSPKTGTYTFHFLNFSFYCLIFSFSSLLFLSQSLKLSLKTLQLASKTQKKSARN